MAKTGNHSGAAQASTGTVAGSAPAGSTGTAVAGTDAAAAAPVAKKKYKVVPSMIISKGTPEKAAKVAALDKLAASLNYKPSALVWLGIDHMLANPPAALAADAVGSATNEAASVASAAGFWTLPIFTGKKVTDIQVVEVGARRDLKDENKRTFFRYTHGDEKLRKRAYGQAIRSAQADAKMLGIKGPTAVENLPPAPAAPAASAKAADGSGVVTDTQATT